MKTLHLVCEDGEPAILNWTVPLNAPDTLYYQVRCHYKMQFGFYYSSVGRFFFAVLHAQESWMEDYCRGKWKINGIVKHSHKYSVPHFNAHGNIAFLAFKNYSTVLINCLIVVIECISLIAIKKKNS